MVVMATGKGWMWIVYDGSIFGRAHAGWFFEWWDMMEVIPKFVKKAKVDKMTIFVTGHTNESILT